MLVDVVHQEWWETVRIDLEVYRVYREPAGSLGWSAILGGQMLAEAGLSQRQASKLIRLNDESVPFTEIADVIDEF